MNIIPLIADLPAPTSTQLWDFIVPAGAIVGLIVLVKSLIPKPRTPAIEAEFVTKAEFSAEVCRQKAEFERNRGEMKEESKAVLEAVAELRRDVLNAGERRAIAIHERINHIESMMARIDERTKQA